MDEKKPDRIIAFSRMAIATVPVLLVLIIAIIAGGVWYVKKQDARYAVLEQQFNAELRSQAELSASTTSALASSIQLLQDKVSLTQTESTRIAEYLSSTISSQQQKVDSLQEKTTKIDSTVGTLEKLSQIDPELLKKYSKVSFLNENYVPSKLGEIKNKYLYNENKTQYFLGDALPFLTEMIDAAGRDGVTVYVKSAYRSFNEQDKLKTAYTITYGSGANSFSADQGYSEHQLGTTADLITSGLGGQLVGFDRTTAYTWLQKNAYKHGFVLSYPKNNSYYIYEPWHWRFVGKKLATVLHDGDMTFYTIDQRTIDEYLISLFDQ